MIAQFIPKFDFSYNKFFHERQIMQPAMKCNKLFALSLSYCFLLR